MKENDLSKKERTNFVEEPIFALGRHLERILAFDLKPSDVLHESANECRVPFDELNEKLDAFDGTTFVVEQRRRRRRRRCRFVVDYF